MDWQSRDRTEARSNLLGSRSVLSLAFTCPRPTSRLRLVHASGNSNAPSLGQVVFDGLMAERKQLPCHFLYDATGSRLFERICELPEYYLTRAELSILRAQADALIPGGPWPLELIELGSGSSIKTRVLIDAALRVHPEVHYFPIDVSSTILTESAQSIAREFPKLRVTGIVGDYSSGLEWLAHRRRGLVDRLVLFLGSTIGNFEPQSAESFLRSITQVIPNSRDALLFGTDLIKSPARLEAAYDDSQGITAQFIRNLLVRINRELGGSFDPMSFTYQARFHEELGRVEMHLISRWDQEVEISAIRQTVTLAAGESIHMESSRKFSVAGLRLLARQAGYLEEGAWLDLHGDYRLQRWRASGDR